MTTHVQNRTLTLDRLGRIADLAVAGFIEEVCAVAFGAPVAG